MQQLKKAAGGGVALSDQVRQRISELIHSRTLVGGHVIIEQRLAEELGVSRTPLREALQRLEGEGMVQKSSGRSYMVRKVDFPEYIQSFKVRYILEPEASALAVDHAPDEALDMLRSDMVKLGASEGKHTSKHWRLDDALHQLIGRYCGNQVLFQTIETLRVTTRLYEIEDVRQRVDKDLAQHLAVLDALAARDAAGARKAMRIHIKSLIAHSMKQVR